MGTRSLACSKTRGLHLTASSRLVVYGPLTRRLSRDDEWAEFLLHGPKAKVTLARVKFGTCGVRSVAERGAPRAAGAQEAQGPMGRRLAWPIIIVISGLGRAKAHMRRAPSSQHFALHFLRAAPNRSIKGVVGVRLMSPCAWASHALVRVKQQVSDQCLCGLEDGALGEPGMMLQLVLIVVSCDRERLDGE